MYLKRPFDLETALIKSFAFDNLILLMPDVNCLLSIYYSLIPSMTKYA